jgi:hypothetical protein
MSTLSMHIPESFEAEGGTTSKPFAQQAFGLCPALLAFSPGDHSSNLRER